MARTLMPGPRVYLLEDDQTLRMVLVEAFGDEGYDVLVASSYADLLRQAGMARAGAVAVADFWGPSHRSLGATERAQIGDLARLLPLVLVTGRPWAVHANADELGVASIVMKPFDIDALLEALDQAFRRSGGSGADTLAGP